MSDLKSTNCDQRLIYRTIWLISITNAKKYYRVDQDTTSNEIFAMFDQVNSETESDLEELLNYSDTEFIADEPLSQENEIESSDLSVLVLEANVHIDPSNEEPEDPLSATEDHADEHFEISTVYSVQVITLDDLLDLLVLESRVQRRRVHRKDDSAARLEPRRRRSIQTKERKRRWPEKTHSNGLRRQENNNKEIFAV